ncbi:MAG: hypothetical protein ACREQR_14045 [Candidatus Binataceae bacterium]
MDETSFDHSSFSHNRARLLERNSGIRRGLRAELEITSVTDSWCARQNPSSR